MSYANPLHQPSGSYAVSSYSTLTSAVYGTQPSSPFISPNRRRLPQQPYTPSSKWKQATGRTMQLYQPIVFDYIGHAKQGVPMRELLMRNTHALAQMIQGANDQIFAKSGLARINFHILWPGYEHVPWMRSIEVHGPMTRAKLGQEIAQMFARYVEKTQYEASRSSSWAMGPHAIKIENLVLISVWNSFDGNWQADVAVDF